MELWQLSTSDHADVADPCGAILRALPNGSVRSRDMLVDQLAGEVRRRFEALEDHDRTLLLIDKLEERRTPPEGHSFPWNDHPGVGSKSRRCQ